MPFPILGNPKPAFFDSSGSPLVAGTLSVLDPADDTNKASYPTYDDAAVPQNANTNPIVLDSRGEPTGAAVGLWGLDGEDYKLVLKDSNGDTIWTMDDVRVPIILPYLQTAAESAASVTPVNVEYPPGCVDRYATNTTPGTTDMTAAFQNAVNSNDYVYTKPGSGAYLVTGDETLFAFPTNNADHAVTVPSDVHIHISSGTTVQIALTTNGNYAAFGCYQKSNIRIDGNGQIIGDLATHDSGGSGEQGFGIDVRDCDQVTIADLQISKCWGDGIYIGGGDATDDATRSTNCEVNNVRSFANRRQGMSVTGVVDFNVNGGHFQTTSGTDPQAGIDFEPNAPLRNLRVNVNGVNSTGNNIGLLFIRTDYFTVTGGNFDNDLRNIQFDDSKGVVVNASLNGTPSQGHFLFNDDTDRKDVTVRGCDIYVTTGTMFCQYPGSGANTTLGDQIFDGNTIHVSGAPNTSVMGGNATTDCKQFINNTLIFESTFADTNLTSASFMTFFRSGWDFSNNKTYNRSSTLVSYDAGAGVTSSFWGPENQWIGGTYNEDTELNGASYVTSFADGDTTPSVSVGKFFQHSDTGATSVTDYDDGYEGQEITVRLTANTTIVHDNAIIRLRNGVNAIGDANTIIKFRMISSIWIEVSRNVHPTNTSTTAALADVSNAINTTPGKVEGYVVFNTNTNKPVWSVGSADGDVWVDATGSTAHTPV